jgi:hypothetical protein
MISRDGVQLRDRMYLNITLPSLNMEAECFSETLVIIYETT